MPACRARMLDGEALAVRLRREIATAAADLRVRGVTPKLVIVIVGDRADSAAYVARKSADCAETGIAADVVRLPAETTQARLLAIVAELNRDPTVHGFMVQLPLPAPLDETVVLDAIDPAKDVDGCHPVNLGRLLAATPDIVPCTPAGVLALLRHYEIATAGRTAAIIGRGMLVGRPLSMLLSLKGIDATVTLLHTRSPDLAETVRRADIVISAAGVAGLVDETMVKPGAAVIGVGISADADGQTVSDIADAVADVAGFVTPRHGSVGALTRAMLLKNLVKIAARAA